MEEVSYGAVTVRIYERSNGKFLVKWREGGKARSTTKTKKSDALKKAKSEARRLDGAMGKQFVSTGEVDVLKRLKELAGDRSMYAWADEIEAALNDAGSLRELRKAAKTHGEQLAAARDGKTLTDLFDRLEAEYTAHRRKATWKTMKTAMKPVCDRLGEVGVAMIGPEDVEGWISHNKPAPKTWNGRLGVWKAAFSRARAWGWLDHSQRTAAEIVPRKREERKSPVIWTKDQASSLLDYLRKNEPTLVAYFAVGCWGGLRPSEAQEVLKENVDLKAGYIHVSSEVAGKLGHERFVPIQPNLAAILEKVLSEKVTVSPNRGDAWRERDAKRLKSFLSPKNAGSRLAKAARKAGVVEVWPHDICRHSFCSYRLAQTHAIGKVAEEAGNSEAVIRKNYRRPVPREAGEDWFTVGL